MDFFIENLKETIYGINKINGEISVKKIRIINDIKSTNRSKINFIWRSLDYLVKQNILRINGTRNPKLYYLIKKGEIDVEQLLLNKKKSKKK